jgi:diguanylate cyclase (GGDEF)-like protein
VLAGAAADEAEAICERLRREFAERPTVLDDGQRIWSTVSAGIALIDPAASRTASMREADAALYAAKRAGRDRLVMAA